MTACFSHLENVARVARTVSTNSDMSDYASTEVGSVGSKREDKCEKVVQSKGRFHRHEKRMLFDLIRKDPGLFHAFLHQRKERMYGTKSWMHEIAHRYNQQAKDKRSLEAIRHHLMFRKSSSKSDKGRGMYSALLAHAKTCQQSDTCTKCLIFQRACVQGGIARCGFMMCAECDKSLPLVSTMIQRDAIGRVPATLGCSSSSSSSSNSCCKPAKLVVENKNRVDTSTFQDLASAKYLEGLRTTLLTNALAAASSTPSPLSVPTTPTSFAGLFSPTVPSLSSLSAPNSPATASSSFVNAPANSCASPTFAPYISLLLEQQQQKQQEQQQQSLLNMTSAFRLETSGVSKKRSAASAFDQNLTNASQAAHAKRRMFDLLS